MADLAEPVQLAVDRQKVCFLILKARAFDAKVDIVEPDPGSNPSDEDMLEVLEDYADDPTSEELRSLLGALNEDEQIDPVALTWLGRGDYVRDDWEAARRDARNARTNHAASYLLGIAQLGDYLEEGLAELGYSCEELEMGRLQPGRGADHRPRLTGARGLRQVNAVTPGSGSLGVDQPQL